MPPPFVERRITLALAADGDVPLRITVSYTAPEPFVSEEIPAHTQREVTFTARKPGTYYVEVQAKDPADVPSPPSGYRLQWLRTDPPFPSSHP